MNENIDEDFEKYNQIYLFSQKLFQNMDEIPEEFEEFFRENFLELLD